MSSLVLAGLGSLIGAASVFLLYLKWRGSLRQPFAVAGAWLGMVISVALWISAYHPDIAVPFAVLVVTVVALILVVRGSDLNALIRYPEPGRRAPDVAERSSWTGAVARTLSIVIAAPLAALGVGMLTWMLMGGHDADRFFMAVFVFLIAFAAIQVWGASARRPWRALGLICVVGVVAVAPMIWGL